MGEFCDIFGKKGGVMVRQILEKLISYPSVTPNECGIYEEIEQVLGEGFERLDLDCDEVKNVFFYKNFASPNTPKAHLCFAGHIDVVPAGDGWSSNPFVPMFKDGYIYGRGAQDMKGGIAAFLSAIKQIQKSDSMISVLLTSDEEGEAIKGSKYVLQELEKLDLLPDFALVAEPTSEEIIGDVIKVGRRGSINGVIKIAGKQGHVAYPSRCINPVELLGSKLGEIAGVELDKGDEYFEPSKIVITDIRGGMEVVNVTPSELKIMFNVRNSTLSNTSDLKNYLQKVLDGLPYTLELKESSKPFLTQKESIIVCNLARSVESVMGFKPKLTSTGGTSDARYFAPYHIEVAELGVRNDRIHAKDERVSVEELEKLEQIFIEFIGEFEK